MQQITEQITPAEMIWRQMDALQMEIVDAAKRCNMSDSYFRQFLKGHKRITVNVAFKLEQGLKLSARKWLICQLDFDLNRSKHR